MGLSTSMLRIMKEKGLNVKYNMPYKQNIQLLKMSKGKSMVRWLTFDTLKSPHLTLATIFAFKIIIKL
jgi:hypothetical protein